MSSFIQLPTLFGSEYFLPGIIIVVLLLALLLLFSSRRRAKAERARLAPVQLPDVDLSETPVYPEPTNIPVAPPYSAAPAVMTQPVGVYTQPVTLAAQPGMMAAAPVMAAPQHTLMAAPPLVAPPLASPPMAQQPMVTQQSAQQPMLAHALAATPAQPMVTMQTVTAQPMMAPQPVMAQPAMYAAPAAPAAATAAAFVPPQAPVSAEPTQDDFLELDGKKGRASRRSKAEKRPAVGNPPFVAQASGTGEDPLHNTVMDLIEGWGDITPEDMKRLELFRPDRLSAMLASVQLPKAKTEDAKLRLTQLRTYAASLERRARDNGIAAAMAASAPEASAVPAAAPAAPAVAPAAGLMTAVAPAAAAVPAMTPPAAAPMAPSTSSRSFYDLDEPAAPPVAKPQTEPTPALTMAPAADPPAADPQADTPALDAPADGPASDAEQSAPKPDGLGGLWAEPRPLWQPDAEPQYEELPPSKYDEVEVLPMGHDDDLFSDLIQDNGHGNGHKTMNGNGNGDGGGNGNGYKPDLRMGVPLDTSALSAAINAPLATPLAAPPMAQVPMAQSSMKPAFAADDAFWDDSPNLSKLSMKVETAEQLLALPADERADMTAFLPPTELAAAFRATHDMGLKRAVIDTLENIGTPASLNALGNCFEDGDPDIQVYALAAADRLLGVVQ